MPKTNKHENNCEKLKSLADEYLHDELILCGDFDGPPELELSGEDRGFVDRHLGECPRCHDFIEAESRYLGGVMQAGYAPEASVFEFVADRIRRENVSVEKPKKRVFIPFGLLSAAAVVLAVLLVSRSGLFDAFMKSNSHNTAADAGGFLPATGMEFGAYPERGEPDMAGGGDMGERAEPEAAADDVFYYTGQVDEFPVAVAPAPGEERREGDFGAFWEANFDLAVEWLYSVNFKGGGSIGEVLKGIEVYKADPEGGFYVVGLDYRGILEKNIGENNIYAEVAGAYNPNAAETGEKYIGIICY